MDSRMIDGVSIPVGDGSRLEAVVTRPGFMRALVLFAHGSGSSRFSPRNRSVAAVLNADGFGTVLADLLTAEESIRDERTAELRFDIRLLADRLACLIDWIDGVAELREQPLGLFGASTGAAAALIAAAERPDRVGAVVSRGGRPDLAGQALAEVTAPTLLIVGGLDLDVLELNREAAERLHVSKRIEVVPNAGHLFEEPGALAKVSQLAADWFEAQLLNGKSLSGRQSGGARHV